MSLIEIISQSANLSASASSKLTARNAKLFMSRSSAQAYSEWLAR